MLTVKVSITSKLGKIRNALEGPPMQRLLKVTATDIVAQVRRNVATEGKPSGDFAQLSGWNQGGGVASKGAREKRSAAQLRQSQRKTGVLEGHSTSDARMASKRVSKHAGYARQKERDFEAGKIPFGPAERWRRTGALVAALVGVIFVTSERSWVELHAGAIGSDEDKRLTALSLGTSNMPARNPTLHMVEVENRFKERLAKLLDGL